MNRFRFLFQIAFGVISLGAPFLSSVAAEPIRVFIRGGQKSHAVGAHEHEKFVQDWKPMLEARGAVCEGGLEFPTAAQLAETDVLILHAQEAGNIAVGQERKALVGFLQRGGGLVVIHAGAVSRDPDWYKTIIGGSWRFGTTQWLEAPMNLYFTDRSNPITKDLSNFELDDEIYYDMDILPEVKVLAAAYTPKAKDTGGKGNQEAQQRAAEAVAKRKGVNIYDIQPQVWTYESTVEGGEESYRAFVHIPGHWYENFEHTGVRTLILRGIAWAGKRENVDELCQPAELGDALRYVEGGVPRPQDLPEQLEVHPEFELSLVASEPLINNPMNLDWDQKGRLWVVETPEYPNGLRQANVKSWMDSGSVKPGQYERAPLDRVSILTDTDGDGVMDKKQVFADEIELATSSVFYKNGVIVCAAPDIWFFEDSDGDDKADKRTKLYTNLGTRDTHAVINNMRWGLDGWIYATHGYSSSDNVTSGDGSKSFGLIGSGVVRFKPDGSAFEQYCSKGGNTWGLDITWDGQVFYTQPTSGVLFHHVVLPEYVLAKGKLPGVTSSNGLLAGEPTHPAMQWEQQAYVQIDQVGSYTAGAGCAIYEGGAWPAKWNYGYFVTEPTLNIVSHFQVEPDGVTYKAKREPGREQTEFIRSKNLWFRPIEVRVGPDGALYVVDFCNQAIIHNDTRGPTHGPANAAVRPDRDHYYGRIWKVQHKEAKPPAATAYRHKPESRGAQGSQALRAYEAAQRSSNADKLFQDFTAARDDWTRSAIVAAASDKALSVIDGVLSLRSIESYEDLRSFVGALLPHALSTFENAEELIAACARTDAKTDAIKAVILRVIAVNLEPPSSMSPALTEAVKKLLGQPALAAATLPLVTKWDKGGALAAEVKAQLDKLDATLADHTAPVEARINAAKGLVAVGGDSNALVVRALARPDASPALQAAIIAALDESGTVSSIVPSLNGLKPELRSQAFEAIVKRPEATNALLTAVKDGSIDRAIFAPGDVARLRSHPNKPIAKRANDLFKVNDAAKDAIIAKLVPEVEKPGDAEKGKMYFAAACAVCHKLGDIGVAVGPPLDGMGAHGPAELLIHIVDPNREVDPSFWAFNISTAKGELLQGVITSENSATVTLATQTGVREIEKSDIAKRENTQRSLMPEGLDALGPEALRDLLSYICGDASREFRILDLSGAFTADSRNGLFQSVELKGGTMDMPKTGNVMLHGVPFFVADAAKNAAAANLIVLKGGASEKALAKSYPQGVEVPVGVATKRLHLLSGVGAWAFPFGGGAEVPALKVSVHYAGGQTEEHVLRNGVEFADYIRRVDVPGSAFVPELSARTQVRWVALDLGGDGVVERLELSSFDNQIVPVVVAITADLNGKVGQPVATTPAEVPHQLKVGPTGKGKGKGKADAKGAAKSGPNEPEPLPAKPVNWEAGKKKVLIIGGGSAHQFSPFFGDMDSATLREAGFTVHYTEDRGQAAEQLAVADVAVISVNRTFFDTAPYRKALMDRVAAGKGLVMLHPGTWYGYKEWPELNAQVVGGGARGHDKLGAFSVSVEAADHPIMEGVPASFEVVDELYYINAEGTPEGTFAIEVLAQTSPSQKYGKPHPSVWITQNPNARVVGIALGHDERVHGHDAFKKVLTNAVHWVAGE